jgi:outer membrane protein assembly factor BamB
MLCFAGLVALAVAPRVSQADDWPAWRGPKRDGICRETGLLKQWPPEGPPLAWKTTGLGVGYSGPSIVGDLLFTMGNRDGKEWVLALDWTQQGKEVWASPVGPIRHDGGGYPGPRATPTFDNGRLYTLGVNGDLLCLEAETGKEIWRKNLVDDFGGSIPQWGYSESVLIDEDWVLCTPGGEKATIAALDKLTGETVWMAPVGDPAAYSSIMKVSIGRVWQYVTLTAKGVISVRRDDGKFLWRYDAPASDVANVATPVWFGQTIFAASAYGTGGGLVWAKKVGEEFQPQEIYFTKDMKNHHGGMILLEDHLYGANDPRFLACLEYRTGEVAWQDRAPGKCSILFADGMLYCRDERGPLSLVEATPEGFELRGQFDQPDRSDQRSWPHPVIANGLLFLRDQDVLLCYDVRAEK